MNNTIFDDVFRTMVEKIPQLAIPLINEVFQTSYPENVEMVQLRNEHHQENGEIITDSCLRIGRKLYHIECQSVDDTTMAIRMIEYDLPLLWIQPGSTGADTGWSFRNPVCYIYEAGKIHLIFWKWR